MIDTRFIRKQTKSICGKKRGERGEGRGDGEGEGKGEGGSKKKKRGKGFYVLNNNTRNTQSCIFRMQK